MGVHGHFAASGQKSYSPASDPLLIEAWEFGDLAPGVVIQTAGIKNGWLAEQGTPANRGTFSNTALFGSLGGTAPGIIFDTREKGLVCSDPAYQAAVAALAEVDVYVIVSKDQAPANAAGVVYEHGLSLSDGFSFYPGANTDTDLTWYGSRVGLGSAVDFDVYTLQFPALVFAGFTNPGIDGGGSDAWAFNGTDLLAVSASGTCNAGQYSGSSLYIGTSNPASLPGAGFVGAIGGIWVYQRGSAEQRAARTSYIMSKFASVL